jgi:UDP-N-acetylglucosamine transferase subunit ALG13
MTVAAEKVQESPGDQDAARRAGIRICLAGSGGGHVRQLLDLRPLWSDYSYFFVSEDTALTRTLANDHPFRYVCHLALGQARLGHPVRMFFSAIRNAFESLGVMLRERPHVLITTGAGAVFFSVVWARLLGAKIVLVESLARFEQPSVFGRMAARFAHCKIAQSAGLAAYWPDAAIFDPIRLLPSRPVDKKPRLYATVGAILPFDRLTGMVADLKAKGGIPEDVLLQVGNGGLRPDGLESVETLPFDEVGRVLKDADIVVCHGGTGSLITALREGCRVVAVPRLFELGEVYDDHQLEITTAFADRGLISVANTPEEFTAAIAACRSQERVFATSDPSEMMDYIRDRIAAWTARTRKLRS